MGPRENSLCLSYGLMKNSLCLGDGAPGIGAYIWVMGSREKPRKNSSYLGDETQGEQPWVMRTRENIRYSSDGDHGEKPPVG